MIPEQKDMGCSTQTGDTTQLNLPNPNQKQPKTNQQEVQHHQSQLRDTTSEQYSAFKKEDNVETTSLSGPDDPDLGFPLGSKRGTTEGHGSAFNKQNAICRRRHYHHWQAEQGFSLV